jgi:cell division protein FtsB
MGRPLNSNPIEYVSDEVEVLHARIVELEKENADLEAHIDHLKSNLDACLAQLHPPESEDD